MPVSALRSRAGRDDGRGLCRQELESAAHLVGPPELRGRLEHGRLPRRAGESAARPRDPHVADTRGIRQARAGHRERPRLLGQRGHVPAPRVRPSHVRLHVDDRRPAERPAARADAGRRSRGARANARHVRPGAVRRFRRLLAVRPLHHARRDRLDAARHLRQRRAHHAEPGVRGDQLRDDPRHSHHPARRPARARQRHSPVDGQRARPLRRRHARHRDDELHRQNDHRHRTAAACRTRSS